MVVLRCGKAGSLENILKIIISNRDELQAIKTSFGIEQHLLFAKKYAINIRVPVNFKILISGQKYLGGFKLQD